MLQSLITEKMKLRKFIIIYKNLFNLIKFYNTKPINKVLKGIITGISDFGIFITLRDFDVTGLLHKRNIKIIEFQKHKIKIFHHGEVHRT